MEINGQTYKFIGLVIANDGITPPLVEILFSSGNVNHRVIFTRDSALYFIAVFTSQVPDIKPTTRYIYEKLCDDMGVSYDLIPENI